MSTKKQKQNKSNSPMVKLFGPNLLSNLEKTESTVSILKDKDLVLLYFSASWCPPCKAFTPILTEFYNNHCIQNNIEIVYVSSDHDIPSFNGYYGKMPWKSIPPLDTAHIKQKLADDVKISGIPALIVLDAKTGKFVTDLAKDDVNSAGSSEEKCKELIQKWKEAEAVPMEEAQLSGTGPAGRGGILWRTLMFFARNPTYIIGVMFLGKRLLAKIQELGEEEEEL